MAVKDGRTEPGIKEQVNKLGKDDEDANEAEEEEDDDEEER